MKCIFVTCGQKELGCCTLQADFIPREVKNSSLGPSALGMNFFFPWDEIHPSGCKTQFFLSAGYEIPHFVYLIQFFVKLPKCVGFMKFIFNKWVVLKFGTSFFPKEKINTKFLYHPVD